MISFAQNAEDVLIARFFEGEPPQFYVDVGAAHPIYDSVTKHFYSAGWRGINLEIRQALFELLKLDRPEDRNLQTCVSDQHGERTFFEVHVESCQAVDNGGLSTLDASLAARYVADGFNVQSYSVPITTLSAILEQEQVTEIGFLKIDVEGHEPQVLRGLDLERWRPRLIVLECTKPLSREFVDSDAMQQILDHRYQLGYFDGLNQFFVRDEDADRLPRLEAPVSVLDGFTPLRVVELTTALGEKNQRIQELEAELEQQRLQLEEALCHMQDLRARCQASEPLAEDTVPACEQACHAIHANVGETAGE